MLFLLIIINALQHSVISQQTCQSLSQHNPIIERTLYLVILSYIDLKLNIEVTRGTYHFK